MKTLYLDCVGIAMPFLRLNKIPHSESSKCRRTLQMVGEVYLHSGFCSLVCLEMFLLGP